jgi:hypothetical protein
MHGARGLLKRCQSDSSIISQGGVEIEDAVQTDGRARTLRLLLRDLTMESV